MESINITNLCELIKNNLPNNKFKICGHVCQPKYSQGHLYLTLKDDISSIKAIMWKSKYEQLKYKINDGDKIIIYGKIDYYNLTGTVSLIIDQIIENEGIGELQEKYNLLKKNFKTNGYFNIDTKLKLPEYINKIAIITSKSGAAIQDFLINIKNNKSKIICDIIDVPVQGSDSVNIITDKLNELKNNEYNYDLIIITRGGGSFIDLFGFSDSILIESVFNFKKIPILSAIGHQIDNPLLDLVADHYCPTPSLASQYLVDINKKYILKLLEIKKNFRIDIIQKLYEKQKQLLLLNNKLKTLFGEIKNKIYQLNNIIKIELNNKKIKLNFLLKSFDNPNIELYNLNFDKITNSESIIKNNILILRWNNQDFKIMVL